ncbi:MAG: class I SAM-dependent methyltransferase [Acidimicrobiales bacterium]
MAVIIRILRMVIFRVVDGLVVSHWHNGELATRLHSGSQMGRSNYSPHVAPTDDRAHWFEDMADHMGEAYLRYSFTRGTEQEVEFLIEELDLSPGTRVLDVGCGPGRHAYALARRGIQTHGVDISERFIELASANAPDGATFSRLDARALAYRDEFDAAISLCQGAFGLSGHGDVGAVVDPDGVVLAGMARSVKPGAPLAVSAFSAYFQMRYLEVGDSFDADRGVNHERSEIVGGEGSSNSRVHGDDANTRTYDLWTSCFTPRELRLLAFVSGLEVDDIYSATPGRYARKPPGIDDPEYLLIAHKPEA